MAAINFVKGEQYYTAEFQINGPVNIHIERAEAGALFFRQRSIDHGSYDLINGANWNNRGDLTIDTAIQGVVYPMWIKIESASEPTLAEMVEGESSGGGAGTESTMEYLDISEVSDASTLLILKQTAQSVKWLSTKEGEDGLITIAPYGLIAPGSVNGVESAEYLAAAIDLEQLVVTPSFGINEPSPLSTLIGSALAAIPRITKEQFYNLEA